MRKPAAHIEALAKLSDADLLSHIFGADGGNDAGRTQLAGHLERVMPHCDGPTRDQSRLSDTPPSARTVCMPVSAGIPKQAPVSSATSSGRRTAWFCGKHT